MHRDWSLITGRRGLLNGRGACEVLPLRKGGGGGGGADKVLAMLRGGGHKKFRGTLLKITVTFTVKYRQL